MLKIEDIDKMVKSLHLCYNPDIEFEISKKDIYTIYANLLELRDIWELIEYFDLRDMDTPKGLFSGRVQEILDFLVETKTIIGY